MDAQDIYNSSVIQSGLVACPDCGPEVIVALSQTDADLTVDVTVDGSTGTDTITLDLVSADAGNDATTGTDGLVFVDIPASLPPSGPAGGDLTGTYPNPTLANGSVNLAGPEVTGILPIANGGTNSGVALLNNALVGSIAGAIVEEPLTYISNGVVRIGNAAVPNNTTSGDLTVDKLSIGNTLFGSSEEVLSVTKTTTTTAAGAIQKAFIQDTISPAANSAATNIGLFVRSLPNSPAGITLSEVRAIGGQINNRQDGAITTVRPFVAIGMVYDSSSPAIPGPATTIACYDALPFSGNGGVSNGAATNVFGFRALGITSSGLTATSLTYYGMTNSTAGVLTNVFGLDVPAITGGTSSNIGIRVGLPSGATTNAAIQLSNTTGAIGGGILFGTDTRLFRISTGSLKVRGSSALTNSTIATLIVNHVSSGTPAAGFGSITRVELQSSTTDSRNAFDQTTTWVVATDATRTSRTVLSPYDTAAREAIRMEASGSAAMLGFLGASAIVRPSAYTLAGSAVRVFPADPSVAYTGIDNLQIGNVYAQVADLNTLRAVVSSLEGVLRQLVTDLASTSGFGLLAAA